MNNSRASGLAFLCLIGVMIALWLSARGGDILSIVVLAVLAALVVAGLGGVVVLLIFYVVMRLQKTTAETVSDMADAQRSMAVALATQGRTMNQLPPGNALPLPGDTPAYPGTGLVLPRMTTFRPETIEGEADEEIN